MAKGTQLVAPGYAAPERKHLPQPPPQGASPRGHLEERRHLPRLRRLTGPPQGIHVKDHINSLRGSSVWV